MTGMAKPKPFRRAEPIALKTVRRAEQSHLQSSPLTKMCLACLRGELVMLNIVFGELFLSPV